MSIDAHVNYYALIRMTRQSILAMLGNIDARDELPALKTLLGDNIPEWASILQDQLSARLINNEISGIVHPYIVVTAHAEGEPFCDFERDPAPISQIKKIVNALYHVEKLVQITNNFALKNVSCDFIDETLHHIYTLCRLLTDWDVDLTSLFAEEMIVFVHMLEQVKSAVKIYSTDTYTGFSKQAGQYSAIGVNYLKPHEKGLDNKSILHLSLAMPAYLSRLKTYMNDALHADLNHEKELAGPEEILHGFDRVVIDGVPLLSNKFYIHFIRPVFELHTDILNEITQIKDIGFDAIFTKFSELKYKWLPKIVAFVDKIEVEMLFQPGVLSDPLMQQLDEYYALLVEYAQYATVDFSDREELISLHHSGFMDSDSEFIEERLSSSYQRWVACETQCILLNDVNLAQKAFFDTIGLFGSGRLSQLDDTVKQDLILYYSVIQPHLAAIDIKLSNAIVEGLLKSQDVNNMVHYLFDALDVLLENSLRPRFDYSDSMDKILAIQPALINRLKKLEATHRFYQALNVDIIKHAYERMGYPSVDIEPIVKQSCNMIMEDARDTMDAGQSIVLKPLVQDKMAEKRATRIVKLPVYSAAIADFRTKLCTLFDAFNPNIQQALRSKSSPGLIDDVYKVLFFETNSIPFPELENISVMAKSNHIEILCQPKQVLALKRLANCLYHLEEASIQFEHLDTNSLKMAYVKRVFEMQRHVTHASMHLEALLTDPYLCPIVNELIQFVHGLLANLKMMRRDYKPAIGWDLCLMSVDSQLALVNLSNEKPTLIKIGNEYFIHGNSDGNNWKLTKLRSSVIAKAGINFEQKRELPYNLIFNDIYIEIIAKKAHSDGQHTMMFFALNAMSMFPKHLAAIDARVSISPETAALTHHQAKAVSADINRIISKAGMYLHLFLETGTIIYLFQELKRRLDEFVMTANHAAWEKLEAINVDLLTSILLEGDQWEDRFCLNPGTIIQPLQQILDAYYQGLLGSLMLHPIQHGLLATSMISLTKRINAAETQKTLAMLTLAELDYKKEKLALFITTLNQYELAWTSSEPIPQRLSQALKTALPFLVESQAPCAAAYLELCNNDSRELSLLFSQMSMVAMHTKLKRAQIKKLANISYAFFLGMIASTRVTQANVMDRLVYLEEQKKLQKERNLEIVETYTETYINTLLDKQLAAYKGKHGSAYDVALARYIDSLKPQVIVDINVGEDIDAQLKSVLATALQHFEIEQGRDFRQLEAIKKAISQLKAYLDAQEKEIFLNEGQKESKAFESNDTLKEKRKFMEKLQSYTARDDLSVHARIKLIHYDIKQPEFKTTMLAYVHHDAFTFRWLLQCINSFLELIKLYTPERTACYLGLAQSSKIDRAAVPLRRFFNLKPAAENNASELGLGPILSIM